MIPNMLKYKYFSLYKNFSPLMLIFYYIYKVKH